MPALLHTLLHTGCVPARVSVSPFVRPSVCPSVRRGSGWQGGWACGQGGTGAPRYREAKGIKTARVICGFIPPRSSSLQKQPAQYKQPARRVDRVARCLAAFRKLLCCTLHTCCVVPWHRRPRCGHDWPPSLLVGWLQTWTAAVRAVDACRPRILPSGSGAGMTLKTATMLCPMPARHVGRVGEWEA